MNKIFITGRMTKDAETGTTGSGKNYARTSIAVRRKYKNAQGEYDSDFFNVSAFGATATYISTYGKKGTLVAIVGEMQQQTYTDANGAKKSSYNIMVESAEVLEKREQSEQPQQTAQMPDYSRPAPVPQPAPAPAPTQAPAPMAQVAMPMMQTQTPMPQPAQPIPDAKNQNQASGFATDDGLLPFDF